MTTKWKWFSITDKGSIIKKSKHFSGIKTELAKSFGLATSTLKTILSQKDAVETKSDTLGNVAEKIKIFKVSPYAALEKKN